MKQFRRLLSAMLVLALLATVLVPGMTLAVTAAEAVVTEEAGFNLVRNPGFEAADSGIPEGGYSEVTINTDPAFVHSGAHSAKVAGGDRTAEGYAYYVSTTDSIPYDVNGMLKVGMWVYLTNAEDASKVDIHIERPDSNGTRVFKPEAKTGWQKVMLTTDRVSGCVRNAIKFTVAGGTAGDVYFDDAFIIPADQESIQLLYNNGFERGDGWGGNAIYVQEPVRSGAYAMKLSAGADIFQSLNWHWYSNQLTTGRALHYSFFVKGGSEDGNIWIMAEVKYGDNQVITAGSPAVYGVAADWTQLSVNMPAPDGPVNEILLHVITEGSGDYVVDDGNLCMVTEVSSESKNPGVVATGIAGINLVDNAGYENSAGELQNWGYNGAAVNTDTARTHSGANSAKVAAGQPGEAFAYVIPSATYNHDSAISAGMWVYLTDADDASHVTIIMERNSEGGTVSVKPQAKAGWQMVRIDAPATSGANHHALKFVVSAGNQNDIYFDDAFLYCHDAESINIMRNGSFENNKDAWADADGFQIAAGMGCSSAAAQLTGELNIFQASGWWPNKSSVDSGKTLYYSAWVKGGENAGTITLRAEVKGETTENYYSETVTGQTDDWQLLSVEIPYPNTNINEILFHITTTGAGVFYADDVVVNAVELAPKAIWKGHSMALDDNLDMRFHVAVKEGAENAVSLQVSVAGKEMTYTVADGVQDAYSGDYIFSVSLAAPQMTEVVSAKLMVGDETIHTGSYTVKGYAESLLAQTQDEKLIALVQAMLNYGGKAQSYFAYRLEDLADMDLNLEALPIPGTENYDCKILNALDAIQVCSATLVLRSRTAIRYYFTVSEDFHAEDYVVLADGKEAKLQDSGDLYYVELTVANPAVLDEAHTVTISYQGAETSVTYSGMHYITRKNSQSGTSQELLALVQALYNYYSAAKAYQS